MSEEKGDDFADFANFWNALVFIFRIFWLKGLESFKFVDGKECLKRFEELDGKVDAVIIDHEIAFDNDLMLIVNIKRINPKTKVLVIASEDEESKFLIN